MDSDSTSLPPIDENACRRFEAAWRERRPERLDLFVPSPDHPHFIGTLEELICIDLEFWWRAGGRHAASGPAPSVDDYLELFPQLNQPPIVRRLREEEARVRRRYAVTLDTGHDGACTRPLREGGLPLPSAETPPARGPGATPEVPDYEVLEPLGRGGMGVVYKARQVSLNRVVALKCLRAGADASAEELRRFRIEAEAVAQLQHPHIVQIYEVGEVDGRPFFALELVEGSTLAQKLRGTPPAVADAARLLEVLARAVHFAHGKGILHRDLKPHNVLLAGEPDAPLGQCIPKITDFGLAKRIESVAGMTIPDHQTATGAILGTPAYMAPEQASGWVRQIGPAVDVHALGVILYEMLTGRTPFRGDSLLDTLEQVRTQEPLPPRSLRPKLSRDLETICLTCLRKEPKKRYGSAQELADDLERFLQGKPIQARRTGVAERALKWMRRRPAAAALLVVSLLAVLGLGLGAFWHNLRLREANAQLSAALTSAEERGEEAKAQGKRAEESLHKAAAVVDDMVRWVGKERLLHVPGMDQVRLDILDRALRLHQKLLQENDTDPQVRQQMAQTFGTLALSFQQLGKMDLAETAYRQAVKIQEELIAAFPNEVSCQRDLAASYGNLSWLLRNLRRYPEAEEANRQGMVLNQRLVDAFPAAPVFRKQLANNCNVLGILCWETKKPREAEAAYRQALTIQEKLAAEFPADRDNRGALALSHNNLGFLLANTKRPEQAEQAYRKTMELQEKLVADFPDVPTYRQDLAGCCSNLIQLLSDRHPDEKEKLARRACELRDRLAADFPGRLEYRQEQAQGYRTLVGLLGLRGRTEEAEAVARQALTLYENLLTDFPESAGVRQHAAFSHGVLVRTLAGIGRARAAEEAARRSLALYEKLARQFPKSPDWQCFQGRALEILADLAVMRGDQTEARSLLERAIRQQEAALKAKPADADYRRVLLGHVGKRADLLVKLADHAEAATAAKECGRLAPEDGQEQRRAAGLLAHCVLLAERDTRLSLGDRNERKQAYADEAMRFLQQAVKKGYRDRLRLQQDPDLEPLRSRDDFKKLVLTLTPAGTTGSK